MHPIRKLFGRKSEDERPESEDNASVDDQHVVRAKDRRHSSARSSTLDPTSTPPSKGTGRKTLLMIRSPFKIRDSISTCRNCRKTPCTCQRDLNGKVADSRDHFLPTMTKGPTSTTNVYDLCDENKNSTVEDEVRIVADTRKMNGFSDHGITESVFQDRFDVSSRDPLPPVSPIEKKIRNLKLNDIDRGGSLRIDAAADHQGVSDTDAANRVTSPRFITKRASITTLSSRGSSSFSGPSSPINMFSSQPPYLFSRSSTSTSSGLSCTPIGLQNTNSTADQATKPENSLNLSNGFSGDFSTASTGNQHDDAENRQPVGLGNGDNTSGGAPGISHGISDQKTCFPRSSSGHVTADGSAGNTSDTPVPPPRKNRHRGWTLGRLSHAGDLPRRVSSSCLNEEQRVSRPTKSRSLSELYWPGAGETGSPGQTNSEELVQSRSSTITSGIMSDLSPLCATPSSLTPSPSSSSSTSEQNERSSSPVNSLQLAAAAAAAFNSDVSEPALSSASSSAAGSNVDSSDVESSLANLAVTSSLTSTLASCSDQAEHRSSVDTALALFSSSDPVEHGVRLSIAASDQSGNGIPPFAHLHMRELAARPLTSLRGLRYSSNCVGELTGPDRRSPQSDSIPPALVRITGLTLGNVMTPLRVTMTPTPASASGYSSPIREAAISQRDDKSHTDNDQLVEHETNDERLRMTGNVMTPPHVTMTTEQPAAVTNDISPDVSITQAEISQLADDYNPQQDNDHSTQLKTNDERLVLIRYVLNRNC